MMTTNLLTGCMIAGAFWLGSCAQPVVSNVSHAVENRRDSSLLKVGDKCPDDLVFRDTSGKDVRLTDLKGKYVFIDVWASWCAPCRAQQPYLAALEEKMKGKAITFVGISTDTYDFRWKGAMQGAKMKGHQWILKDLVFNYRFDVRGIPRYILLDKQSRIVDLRLVKPQDPQLEVQLNKLKGI